MVKDMCKKGLNYIMKIIKKQSITDQNKKDETKKIKASPIAENNFTKTERMSPVNIAYITRSGTKYSIDTQKSMMRNGELFFDEGRRYKYAGIVDHENAKRLVDDDSISATRGNWGISHLIYVIHLEGRLGTKEMPFEQIVDNINEKNALLFINRETETTVLTSPIVSHKKL